MLKLFAVWLLWCGVILTFSLLLSYASRGPVSRQHGHHAPLTVHPNIERSLNPVVRSLTVEV